MLTLRVQKTQWSPFLTESRRPCFPRKKAENSSTMMSADTSSRPRRKDSTIFTRKIINQPSTLRQSSTKTLDRILKNCHPGTMYNSLYLERARLVCRYGRTEVFRTGDLLLYRILQANHLAFLFLHIDNRYHHLY